MACTRMSTVQQEFDADTALLGLYEGLPYVRKLGYSVGEMDGRILVGVVIDDGADEDESYDNFLMSVKKAGEFMNMMPARMRDEYDVVPIVTGPCGGHLAHFHAMTVVIDR